MRDIESIVKEVAEIYSRAGNEAEEYLLKARKLEKKLGPGPAIVYCWFYSVPQKWTQVEPKIFELMKFTNSFNIDKIILMSVEEIAAILKPMIFYNEISFQLKSFCKAIRNEYHSWDKFVKKLCKESIFSTFRRLRKHRNIRLTFKNLAAMKIFVGTDDDLIILDVHVGRVLGMNKGELGKYRVHERLFKDLSMFSGKITDELKRKGFQDITMIKWSLAIWFDKAKMQAKSLLDFIHAP